MGVALDLATDLGSTASTSLTGAHVCSGSNRILFVAVFNFQSSGSSDTVTGVTYNGIGMTQVSSVQVPSNAGYWLSLWYSLAPATGSHTVAVSLSSNNLICYAIAQSYTGVKQATPIDVSGSSTATATSISNTLTTAVSNDWAVAAVQATDSTLSAGAATTLRKASAVNTATFDSNANLAPGSNTLTANLSASRNMAMIMTALEPQVDFVGGII